MTDQGCSASSQAAMGNGSEFSKRRKIDHEDHTQGEVPDASFITLKAEDLSEIEDGVWVQIASKPNAPTLDEAAASSVNFLTVQSTATHKGRERRRKKRNGIQFYAVNGKGHQECQLGNPNEWQGIATVKIGRVPDHLPFRQWSMGDLMERLFSSTLVATSMIRVENKPAKRWQAAVLTYQQGEALWAMVYAVNAGVHCLPFPVCYLLAEEGRLLDESLKGVRHMNWTMRPKECLEDDGGRGKRQVKMSPQMQGDQS